MYKDEILNCSLASLTIEMVTFNPNYQMMVVTNINFDNSNSGLVVPFLTTRAIRVNPYSNNTDYFRAFLEIIFVIYIAN